MSKGFMSKRGYPTIIGADAVNEGKLMFKDEARINGSFTGEIVSEGRLVIGKGGVVRGIVQVGELVVIGTLHGDIIASRSTLLHQEAEVGGTLKTRRLVMEDGAILQGQVTMAEDVSLPGTDTEDVSSMGVADLETSHHVTSVSSSVPSGAGDDAHLKQ